MTNKPLSRYMCGLFAAIGFCILYIPIVTLIIYSFGIVGGISEFSLKSYEQLFQNEELIDAVVTSLLIAGLSSTVSVVVGGLAAIGVDRARSRLQVVIRYLTYAPLVLPEIVFGLGLLIWFVFLKVSLGYLSLIIAHVTFSVSYVLLTVLGRVQTIDRSIDDAAKDLGANSWQLLVKIYFPMLMPALMSGWIMAFTLSFDDFLISFFTSGPETVTLPLALYSSIKFGMSAEIFAMASFIFALSFLGALFVSKRTDFI